MRSESLKHLLVVGFFATEDLRPKKAQGFLIPTQFRIMSRQ